MIARTIRMIHLIASRLPPGWDRWEGGSIRRGEGQAILAVLAQVILAQAILDQVILTQGYGVAATGLGLNAASSIGDWDTYKGLKKMMNPFGRLFQTTEKVLGNNLLTRIGTDLLSSSIWLNAETKQDWYNLNYEAE